MKKPVEAIERMRIWAGGEVTGPILAYLDSLPEWPAELDYAQMIEIARKGSWNQCREQLAERDAELAALKGHVRGTEYDPYQKE